MDFEQEIRRLSLEIANNPMNIENVSRLKSLLERLGIRSAADAYSRRGFLVSEAFSIYDDSHRLLSGVVVNGPLVGVRTGRNKDCQFMAGVGAALHAPAPSTIDWRSHKHWISYGHKFDRDGRWLSCEWEYHGTTADGEHEVVAAGNKWVSDYLKRHVAKTTTEISVDVFSCEIKHETFGSRIIGLIPDYFTNENGDVFVNSVSIEPSDSAIMPPFHEGTSVST